MLAFCMDVHKDIEAAVYHHIFKEASLDNPVWLTVRFVVRVTACIFKNIN